MALVNEILSPRWNKLLTRLLSMKGQNPAPQLTPEIGANFDLFNAPPELALLQDVVLFSQGAALVAGAGFAGIAIRNPAGSGLVVVIRGWGGAGGAADGIVAGFDYVGTVNAAFVGITAVPSEGRLRTTDLQAFPDDQLGIQFGTQVTSAALISPAGWRGATGASTELAKLDLPPGMGFVLGENQTFWVQNAVVAHGFQGYIYGYYRPFEPSEPRRQ